MGKRCAARCSRRGAWPTVRCPEVTCNALRMRRHVLANGAINHPLRCAVVQLADAADDRLAVPGRIVLHDGAVAAHAPDDAEGKAVHACNIKEVVT